jgi:hypothetical protein
VAFLGCDCGLVPISSGVLYSDFVVFGAHWCYSCPFLFDAAKGFDLCHFVVLLGVFRLGREDFGGNWFLGVWPPALACFLFRLTNNIILFYCQVKFYGEGVCYDEASRKDRFLSAFCCSAA